MTIPFSQVRGESIKLKVSPSFSIDLISGAGIRVDQLAPNKRSINVDFSNLERDDIASPLGLYVGTWDTNENIFKLVKGDALKGATGPTGADGAPGPASPSDYDTRAAAAAATIAAPINYIRTFEYASGMGGGALYKRGSTSPGSFTSNAGAVTWVLAAQDLNVCMFGADPTGATNCASAFNLACTTGKPIYIPPGTYLIEAAITIGNAALRGSAQDASILQRAAAYTSGDIISLIGNGPTTIRDIYIKNANGTINNTAGAAIHIGSATDIVINNVKVWNGANGIYCDGDPSARIMISNYTYVQDSVYGTVNDSFNAIAFVGAHHFDCYLSDVEIIATAGASHCLQRGVYVTSCDGIQISNIGIGGPNAGLFIAGGSSHNINDIYITQAVVDNVKTPLVIGGINSPNSFSNIRVSNSHFNGQNSAGSGDGITVGGDADYVQIIGCNIGLAYGNGVVISAGNNYEGVAKRSIIISGNQIGANNLSNTPSLAGLVTANNASGFVVTGNTIGNRGTLGHQAYGIIVGNSNSNFVINGNSLIGNATGGLALGTSPTNYVNANNIS